MPRFVLALVALVVAGSALVLPADVAAQQTQKKRPRTGQTIEIRGQVPTPQVVTVRPRETPTYTRDVLTTNFYDHSFWSSILPAYQLVPQRQVSGPPALDSVPPVPGVAGVPLAVVPPSPDSRLLSEKRAADSAAAAAAAARTAGAAAAGGTAADRQREIDAIRRELALRRARLDSLNRVVNQMGKGKTPAQPTTPAPARDSTGTTPPR
jgi:hypothetical protein